MNRALLLAALMLTGCASDHSWSRCDLLRIAFEETDELAPAWYLHTAEELRACGMRHIAPDAGKGRGKA